MHVAHDSDLAWTTIDEAIVRLAQQKGALDVEIGRCLLVAQRERVERRLGFGSFVEYVERRLGYDARTTHERLRVARALEALPRLAALLRAGARSWSAVRELTRVATPETEEAWVEASDRMTVRQVEAMVAGHAPGARPEDAPDPLLATHRLVVELSPEELAEWREAAEKIRTELGPAASTREVLRAMVRRELGARPNSEAGYQTAVTLCAGCERTWMRAGGDAMEVEPAVGDCARCDSEVVGVVEGEGVGEGHADAGAGGGAHVGAADVPDVLRHLVARGGGRALARVFASVIGAPRSMTPKLRAAVRTRDRGRCVVPGCRHVRFVDLHHLRWRVDGGANTVENVISLCTQHHARLHAGELAIEGSPSTGLVFRHAGGALYGVAREGEAVAGWPREVVGVRRGADGGVLECTDGAAPGR